MSGGNNDHDKELSRKGRVASLVLIFTMVLWVAAQWIGGRLGLPTRFAFLFDFAALAAIFWSLVVTYQIWRARQDN